VEKSAALINNVSDARPVWTKKSDFSLLNAVTPACLPALLPACLPCLLARARTSCLQFGPLVGVKSVRPRLHMTLQLAERKKEERRKKERKKERALADKLMIQARRKSVRENCPRKNHMTPRMADYILAYFAHCVWRLELQSFIYALIKFCLRLIPTVVQIRRTACRREPRTVDARPLLIFFGIVYFYFYLIRPQMKG
jgi:hypothetical protein